MNELTKKETREQATARILKDSCQGNKYPMKRYTPDLEIGVFRRPSKDKFVVSINENIWGASVQTDCIEYPSIDWLMKDGWLID